MAKTRFVYEIYIASTPATVWKGLLDGEFTRQYWHHDNVSDWKPGSAWEHRRIDGSGRADILGEVIEANPPHRLVMSWAYPDDRNRRDRHSRVTIEVEPVAEMTRLTVTHDELEPGSDMAQKIAWGWPRVLSSLKSLLETGKPLNTWGGSSHA